jgi:thiaminase/transcriptional activator TenA
MNTVPLSTGTSASALLRERGAASWAAAVSHPMVAEIGAGSLPHETFRYYFEQNVLYLEDYARAIALIIGRAPDLAAVTVLTRFLGQIVDTELPANYAFLARLGGPSSPGSPGPPGSPSSPGSPGPGRPDPAAVMAPATYAYTRHLLDTAGRHDLPAGLAAVLPCQWSYGELGTRLARALPADPVYADWIGMFAGDGYDELVQASTSLLDQHADTADEARMTSLAAVFDRSTRYELAFWDMAFAGPGGQPG